MLTLLKQYILAILDDTRFQRTGVMTHIRSILVASVGGHTGFSDWSHVIPILTIEYILPMILIYLQLIIHGHPRDGKFSYWLNLFNPTLFDTYNLALYPCTPLYSRCLRSGIKI